MDACHLPDAGPSPGYSCCSTDWATITALNAASGKPGISVNQDKQDPTDILYGGRTHTARQLCFKMILFCLTVIMLSTNELNRAVGPSP